MTPRSARFTIVIVGRPNVGKSTLFNRLAGRRLALVHDTPGVTRDRREVEGELRGRPVRLIDTAGLEEAEEPALEGRMLAQTEKALSEADLALFVYDARAGVTPMDEHFARWLRRAPCPVLLVANKCEGRAWREDIADAYRLGHGEPVPISAEHAEGLGELDRLIGDAMEGAEAPSPAEDEEEREEAARPLHLAIVGRPNAGKSTLLNRLLGEERAITGPEPGLTRDAISIDWHYADRPVRLFDTAGLRRRARVTDKLERMAVDETRNAIRFADVVIVMIDARTVQPLGGGFERQDLTIARQVEEEGRALVIALNKWDLIDDPRAVLAAAEESAEQSLAQIKGVPIVPISALDGRYLDRLMDAVFAVETRWNRRVSTGRLNRWLEETVEHHPPPMAKGRRLRVRYATQVKSRPPTFALFVSLPKEMPDSYLNYLANGLRERFDLWGIPLRLVMRKGENPYAGKG